MWAFYFGCQEGKKVPCILVLFAISSVFLQVPMGAAIHMYIPGIKHAQLNLELCSQNHYHNSNSNNAWSPF